MRRRHYGGARPGRPGRRPTGTVPRVRILVISDLYPPVAFGGYEMECASVVDHLRLAHDVHVLTCDRDADRAPADPTVLRELPYSSSELGGYEMECASVVDHLRLAHDVHVLTCDRDADRAPADPTVLRELPYSSS